MVEVLMGAGVFMFGVLTGYSLVISAVKRVSEQEVNFVNEVVAPPAIKSHHSNHPSQDN